MFLLAIISAALADDVQLFNTLIYPALVGNESAVGHYNCSTTCVTYNDSPCIACASGSNNITMINFENQGLLVRGSLSTHIASLASFEKLSLRNCQLHGTILPLVQPSFKNLSVAFNDFTGFLPSSWSPNMAFIDVIFNKLHGTLNIPVYLPLTTCKLVFPNNGDYNCFSCPPIALDPACQSPCEGELYSLGFSYPNCSIWTASPTAAPTPPTPSPTLAPSQSPTPPTLSPTAAPTQSPTPPTLAPTAAPAAPSSSPTPAPSLSPSSSPSPAPSPSPTVPPPTAAPTPPTFAPTHAPSLAPTPPTPPPTPLPSLAPTAAAASTFRTTSTDAAQFADSDARPSAASLQTPLVIALALLLLLVVTALVVCLLARRRRRRRSSRRAAGTPPSHSASGSTRASRAASRRRSYQLPPGFWQQQQQHEQQQYVNAPTPPPPSSPIYSPPPAATAASAAYGLPPGPDYNQIHHYAQVSTFGGTDDGYSQVSTTLSDDGYARGDILFK